MLCCKKPPGPVLLVKACETPAPAAIVNRVETRASESGTRGMNRQQDDRQPDDDSVLSIYLLGTVEFSALQALQRRLVEQTRQRRRGAALLLCEHPPLLTVGRHGRPGQIHFDPEVLAARRWPVRWVNRGGGCWLHLPGQLAIYPILALEQFDLGLEAYRERLQQVLIDLLDDFAVPARMRPGQAGVWVDPRPVACVGLAVHDWVVYYGGVFNLNADLVPFRWVECGSPGDEPMTSLVRERRGPVRPGLVRERLLEHFQKAFPFERVSLFFSHPLLREKVSPEAVLAWV